MAECVAGPNGTLLLRENHCPICVAAKSCQGLCREELSLFQAVLGAGVRVQRTDHVLAGAQRCAYVIAPEHQRKNQDFTGRKSRAGDDATSIASSHTKAQSSE
jgi:predicted ArsR family transcriptional regulator